MHPSVPLDQFYTKPTMARHCHRQLISALPNLGARADECFFIEPSAGAGNFYRLLSGKNKIGLDIAPRCDGIVRGDFLTWDFRPPSGFSRERIVVVGNPPFGRRARMAVDFFNRAAEFADTIAFIVPMQFRKYSAQSKLHASFKLVRDRALPPNAFYRENGRDFDANCAFQIWTRLETSLANRRILKPPPIAHPDFEMRQYNNTQAALKVFDAPFDFAVPRQGYEDYSRREKRAENCERQKQWILFAAESRAVLRRLMTLDFWRLSRKNTTIPGFGKADVVGEYGRQYA